MSLVLTLALAAMLHAPTVRCDANDLGRIVLRDAAGIQLEVRQVDRPNDCLVYAETRSDRTDFSFEFQPPEGTTGVIAPAGVASVVTNTAEPVWTTRFTLASARTQALSFRLPRSSGNPLYLTFYIVFRPTPAIEASSDCSPRTVCLREGHETTIPVAGTNLDEVDASRGAVFVRKGTTDAQRFGLERSTNELAIRVPEGKLTAGATYEVTLFTGAPRYLANGTTADSISIPDVPVAGSRSNLGELKFLQPEDPAITLFAGETLPVRIDPSSLGRQRRAVYNLTETVGESPRRIAMLNVLDSTNGNALLTGVLPGARPFRRSVVPEVMVMLGDTPVAHAHVQVISPPRIERTALVHLSREYTDTIIHLGETVRLVVTGTTLTAFDSLRLPSGTARWVRQGDREGEIEITPRYDARGSLPLAFHSSLVADTTVTLPTAPSQRPHALGFVRFRYRGHNSSCAARRDARTLSLASPAHPARDRSSWCEVTFGDANTSLRAAYLDRARIYFTPDSIDARGPFGVQYLVVDAGFFGPDRRQIARDSVRVAVRPSEAYQISPGYAVGDVSIDDLLHDAPRHAKPGSYLQLTIRHDTARYQTTGGGPATIHFVDGSRFRIAPRLDLLTGLTYFAQVRDSVRGVHGVPVGGSADSLVRYTRDRNWKIDVFDVSGGASAGVDLDWLTSNFKPSLLRLRIGALLLRDPFDASHPRRLGVSVLYPVEFTEITGNISLSLAVGYGRLIGGRGFGVIAPGVGVRLPGLSN